MKSIYQFLVTALNSWLAVLLVMAFCGASFYAGQSCADMNLFAASGAVMTVFGLLSMIRFTTMEKYLNQEAIIAASTGVTGPPLTAEESERISKENQKRAAIQIKKELRAEIKGIALTIVGTLIWAYGSYVPVFHSSVT